MIFKKTVEIEISSVVLTYQLPVHGLNSIAAKFDKNSASLPL